MIGLVFLQGQPVQGMGLQGSTVRKKPAVGQLEAAGSDASVLSAASSWFRAVKSSTLA